MKMGMLTAYHTDVGTQKKINEDSLCLQVAETEIGTVVLAVVCDGMGGLQRGELASANVTDAFKEWFETDFPALIKEPDLREKVFAQWADIMNSQNHSIAAYGSAKHIILGTTISVFLLLGTEQYLIGHVGDSRVYCINQSIQQLTEDQTVVNEEIKRGNLTPEEAEKDSRRNVLLQCIGATPNLVPSFFFGNGQEGDLYLLCSDGFRHEVSSQEIAMNLKPQHFSSEVQLQQVLQMLVELNIERGERDNITALAITYKGEVPALDGI